MHALLRYFLIALALFSAAPASAQKTTQAQEMAKPGESTEPPKPHAAPVAVVHQLELPRAGGVLVFGADGIGLDLVRALLAQGNHVTVVTSDEARSRELTGLGAAVTTANMSDPDSLKAVFTSAPFRVVISIIGERGAAPAADNKHAIDATKGAGLERFIMLSRIGVGDSADAQPWYVREASKVMYAKTLQADNEAEVYLRASGLDYTIVRLGGLVDKPAGRTAVLTPDRNVYSQVARADLAALLAKCTDDDTAIKKTLLAFDPTRVGFLALFGYQSEAGR